MIVHFAGSIDERTHFDKVIGSIPKELHVFARNVPRINSEGVRAWVQYFQGLTEKGVDLKFFECSTAIVEQLNLISNFSCGGSVESIFIPFVCHTCKSELVGLFETKNLTKKKFKLPGLQCTRCGGNVEFDDIQEEYFAFLRREFKKHPKGSKK